MKFFFKVLVEQKKSQEVENKSVIDKIDGQERKLRESFVFKFSVSIILLIIFGFVLLFFKNIFYWVALLAAVIYFSWIYYCTRNIMTSILIILIFFMVSFSINEMKRDEMEIIIYSVSEKFTEEKNIKKESLENDIVGRINNIKDSASRNMKETVLENNKYATNNKDSKENPVVLATGLINNNPGSEINIKFQDVGISLNSFLRSLKKNNCYGQGRINLEGGR
jgi:ABC-type multidrug transport system fused ATPase/permease subunit